MTELDLAPVVEDLSCYIAGGRVTDATIALEHAAEAERLGLRRAWVSERYNLKECGALFGAICAQTPRLNVGTGATTISARLPNVLASMAATVNSMFGRRAILGLGVGNPEYNKPHGVPTLGYSALRDYAGIVRRLFDGETIDYDGPAGRFDKMVFTDVLPEERRPEVWHVQLGGPKACTVSADPAFDGVLLGFYSTPTAMAESVRMIHEECERIGRDPATLHIAASVCTGPDYDDAAATRPGVFNPSYGDKLVKIEQLKVLLMLTILEPKVSDVMVARNGWDPDVCRRIRTHELFAGMDELAPDYFFRDRSKLMDVAGIIPDAWIEESCAVGSTEACVKKLEEFRAIPGVSEIAFYCSSPGQNADVLAAWRERSVTA